MKLFTIEQLEKVYKFINKYIDNIDGSLSMGCWAVSKRSLL